jgi:hypothetical protein
VSPSDFELILSCIKANPGLTARELGSKLRKQGHERFSSRLTNQLLYRLHAASMIDRDGTGDKPRWHPNGDWSDGAREPSSASAEKRLLDSRDKEIRSYEIASVKVKVLLTNEMSLNDPYMIPDWVGSHIISSVNTVHPFWTLRLGTATDRALYCMMAAIDAYLQWKVAQLHEPPDATELQKMKDDALRFCTLLDAESPTPD